MYVLHKGDSESVQSGVLCCGEGSTWRNICWCALEVSAAARAEPGQVAHISASGVHSPGTARHIPAG